MRRTLPGVAYHDQREASILPIGLKTPWIAFRRRLGTGVRFTTYDFQAVVTVVTMDAVKKANSSPLHYVLKQTGAHCYWERLVDEIVEKAKADQHCLTGAD